MVKFQEFCNRITTDAVLGDIISTESSTDIPERYKAPTETLITILKNKRKRFDSINVPFVESVFEQNYLGILKEKMGPDADIPDSIIIRLSEGIFGEKPNGLNVDQQAIIKVLATYICIQN